MLRKTKPATKVTATATTTTIIIKTAITNKAIWQNVGCGDFNTSYGTFFSSIVNV